MEKKMLQINKIKFNKETQTEEIVPLNILRDEVACIYKDGRGVFLITKQGFMHKVAYEMEYLIEVLGI